MESKGALLVNRQLFYFLAVGIPSGITFLCNYLYSQRLSLDEYGTLGLYIGLLNVLLGVVIFGQSTAFTSVYFSDEKVGVANYSLSEYSSSIFVILTVGVISIVSMMVLDLLGIYTLSSALFVVIFSVLIVAVKNFNVSVITCIDNHIAYFISVLIFSLVFISVVLTFSDFRFYFVGIASAALAQLIFLTLIIKRSLSVSSRPGAKVFSKKELVILGSASIPGMIISAANSYVDRYMISLYLDLSDVGLYTLASTIAVGLGGVVVTSGIRGSIVTLLKSIQNGDFYQYTYYSNKIFFGFQSIAIFSTVLYYLIGKEAVVFVFGEKYLDAASYMLPLFLTVLFFASSQVIGQVLIQKKKLYVLVIVSAVVFLINILLNYIFIPLLGVRGAIYSFATTAFLSGLFVYYFSVRELPNVKFPVTFYIANSVLLIVSLEY